MISYVYILLVISVANAFISTGVGNRSIIGKYFCSTIEDTQSVLGDLKYASNSNFQLVCKALCEKDLKIIGKDLEIIEKELKMRLICFEMERNVFAMEKRVIQAEIEKCEALNNAERISSAKELLRLKNLLISNGIYE